MENKPSKTTLGLDENVESVLCYAGVWVSGFLFLLLEKDNKNVRFHAMQSLVAFLGLSVLSFVLGRMFFFFWHLLGIVWVCLWILLIVKAYNGERFKLPVIGDIAENLLGKVPASMGGEPQEYAPAPPTAQPSAPAQGPQSDSSQQAAAFSEPQVSGKDSVLRAVEQALSQYPQLSIIRSKQTDLEFKSVLADADLAAGKRKVEYNACLLAKETEKTVLFWELVKKSGSGVDTAATFQPQVESFNNGRSVSGQVKKAASAPDSHKAAGYNWDYGLTRGIIENVVKSNGWVFKTVLTKSKAMY